MPQVSDIKTMFIQGRQWWRRGYGGMYHTATVTINGEFIVKSPEDGGSGEVYLQSALESLQKLGWFEGFSFPKFMNWILDHPETCVYSSVDVQREKDL